MRSLSSRLPRPIVAGIGLASVLPDVLTSLPSRALSGAAQAAGAYAELVARGDAVLASHEESIDIPEIDGWGRRAGSPFDDPEKFAAEFDLAEDDELDEADDLDSLADAAPEVPVSLPVPAAIDESADLAAAGLVAAAADRAQPPPTSLAHDALPVPNFDQLTLASLRARLSKLTVSELEDVRDYEAAHARRLPVLSMLETRIARVTAGN